MPEKNSTLIRTSRYVAGGVTEVNSLALEWWERNVILTNESDTSYVVERRFVGRLDLIAAYTLGEPRLWWVIAQFNNILDPYSEVTEGAILYIPSKTRVDQMMNGTTGGIPSTREVPTSILPIV